MFVLGAATQIGLMLPVESLKVVCYDQSLCVNNLPEVVTSKLWMFADDSKIGYRIVSSGNILQNDLRLHNIINWCSEWLMDLNFDKLNVSACCLIMELCP